MPKDTRISLFDVSVCSLNMGDQVITHNVRRALAEVRPQNQVVSLASHDFMSFHSYRHLAKSQFAVVGGSNLLSSNMPLYRQWKLRLLDPLVIPDTVLMGVGWWQYQKPPNAYTTWLLKRVLHSSALHSVRDEYTRTMLAQIGITNVVNTNCPTMWRLTDAHCAAINGTRSAGAVTTITDYNFDKVEDLALLSKLLEHYETVHLWPQSARDLVIIRQLQADGKLEGLQILPADLDSYTHFLKENEVDYVGTRLHAGIHALNISRRATIVAVDNRAREISKDTGLHVLERGNLDILDEWIEGDRQPEITLNWEAINAFRQSLAAL